MSSPPTSMAAGEIATGVPSAVTDVLGGLKRRIRLYVVVEGLALVPLRLFALALGLVRHGLEELEEVSIGWA